MKLTRAIASLNPIEYIREDTHIIHWVSFYLVMKLVVYLRISAYVACWRTARYA